VILATHRVVLDRVVLDVEDGGRFLMDHSSLDADVVVAVIRGSYR